MANDMREEKEAIQQLIEKFTEAWNKHDAKEFSLVFAEDADFTNVFGQKLNGRSAIGEFHAPTFLSMFKASHFAPSATNVRFIYPDVAAVDVTWEMSGAIDPHGNPWPDRKGLMNLIVKLENGIWSILIMHNMDLPASPK